MRVLKRLPIEKQTRLNYAIVAFLGSYSFCVAVGILSGVLNVFINQMPFLLVGSVLSALAGGLLYSAVTAFFALLCWPSKVCRTKKRMIWAAILTVFCVTLLFGVLLGSMALFDSRGSLDILGAMQFFGLIMAVGNIATLGIPYAIAVLLSLRFVEVA